MKRMKVLFGNRRMMVLLTLAILVLAATALVASSASFTATSANPGNVFTAGALTISNKDTGGLSREGMTVLNLTASGMKPSDTAVGTAVIKNTGSIAGTFKLTGVMDASGGTYDAAFAHYLTLTVTEDATAIVTNKPLDTALASGIPLTGGAPWLPAAQHTYVFTVTFPNGAAGVENAYMGKSATIGLTWSAVQ